MRGNSEHLERYGNLASQCSGIIARLSVLGGYARILYGSSDAALQQIETMLRAVITYQGMAKLEYSFLRDNDGLAASSEDSEHLLLRISGLLVLTEDNIRGLEEKLKGKGPDYNIAPALGNNPLIIQGTPLSPNI